MKIGIPPFIREKGEGMGGWQLEGSFLIVEQIDEKQGGIIPFPIVEFLS